MAYNLQSLSDGNINLLITVMSSLLHKAELAGAYGPIRIGNAPKGVSNDEQHAILSNLDRENYISFSNDEKSVWINENVYVDKSFIDFYNQVHDEHHRRIAKTKTEKAVNPHYDAVNGIIYVREYKATIKKHDEDTKQNQLLKYIFITNAKDIAREFDFTEFPFDDVSDKKKFKEICRTACTSINKKIAKDSGDQIIDFLEFNTRTFGYVKVNPQYLPKTS